MSKVFILFFFLSFFSIAKIADLKGDCEALSTIKDKLPGSYCVYKTPDSKNKDILYYFHGKGLNEKTWGEDSEYFTALVRKAFTDNKLEAPTVIAISFGMVWALVDEVKPDTPTFLLKNQTVKLVSDELIPAIENKLEFKEPNRIIVGESMGSFNTIQLAFKTKLFKKVALLCPIIPDISPFASKEEIEKFINDTKADPKKVNEMILLATKSISKENWENHSPLHLAEKLKKQKTLPETKFYVSCGNLDAYGVYPGTEKFVDILKDGKMDVDWRFVYGGHCAVDPISLAKFIAQ